MEVLYLYTRGPQVPHVREANKRWQEENIWITTKKWVTSSVPAPLRPC